MLNVGVWIQRPHHSCTIFGTNQKHLAQHTGVSQSLHPKSVPTEHSEEEAFLWWGQLLPSTFQSNITVKYNIQCSFKAPIQIFTQNSWNAYSHPLAYTYYGFLPFQDRGLWPKPWDTLQCLLPGMKQLYTSPRPLRVLWGEGGEKGEGKDKWELSKRGLAFLSHICPFVFFPDTLCPLH